MEGIWSADVICGTLILGTAGQTFFPFSSSFGKSVQVDVRAMVLEARIITLGDF